MPTAAPEPKTQRKRQPRCADCFFKQNLLCALGLEKPCPTFRPAHPDGLRPPQQLTFMFRTRRAAAQWPGASVHAPADDALSEAAVAELQPDACAAGVS